MYVCSLAQCASQSATKVLRVYETIGTEHLLLYAKQFQKQVGRDIVQSP